MAADNAPAVEPPAKTVGERSYITPVADFLVVFLFVCLVAFGAVAVIIP